MEKRAKFVLCSLLISLLSITALAGNSLTARIPATIAAGNYAEAEILITEAVKIGAITALAAESYRRTIRHAQEGAPDNQQSRKQQPWTPLPDATSPDSSENRQENQGRIYVTYTKFNQKTKRFYSGRTSMIINMDKPFRPQAEAAVAARDSNHHIDENDEPKDPAFRGAEIDAFDVRNCGCLRESIWRHRLYPDPRKRAAVGRLSRRSSIRHPKSRTAKQD